MLFSCSYSGKGLRSRLDQLLARCKLCKVQTDKQPMTMPGGKNFTNVGSTDVIGDAIALAFQHLPVATRNTSIHLKTHKAFIHMALAGMQKSADTSSTISISSYTRAAQDVVFSADRAHLV